MEIIKILFPLNIEKEEGYELPQNLQLLEGLVEISEFTIQEKEHWLGIKNLTRQGSSWTFQKPEGAWPQNLNGVFPNQILDAKYKFVFVPSKQENISGLIDTFDYVFRLVFRNSYLVVFQETELGRAVTHNVHRSPNLRTTNKVLLGEVSVSLAIELVELLTGKLGDGKTKILLSYFGLSTSVVGSLDLQGALYVSILETIFTPDNDSELSYRLQLRIANYFNGGIELKKTIKKFYEKRSNVLHGLQSDQFDEQGMNVLEGLMIEALIDYLKNPTDFSSENLDLQLLS